MDLTLMADYVLVAAKGGYTAASLASGRSKATLSRNVKRLEDDLGTRLIERTPHAFQLTDDGRMLLARSEGLLTELQEIGLEMKGRGPEPRGRLRISSPIVFSHVFLGSLAAEFKAAYPLVQFEVTVEDRLVDLVEEGYDAVIRVNPNRRSSLVGRCFFRDAMVVAAAPQFPIPKGHDTTPVTAVVGLKARDRRKWRIRVGSVERDIRFEAALCLPTPLMVRDAVVAGAGAAELPLWAVKDEIAAGRLVRWGDLVGETVELWVLHTSRRASNSKVQAFVNFVCDRFLNQHVPTHEG